MHCLSQCHLPILNWMTLKQSKLLMMLSHAVITATTSYTEAPLNAFRPVAWHIPFRPKWEVHAGRELKARYVEGVGVTRSDGTILHGGLQAGHGWCPPGT